MRDVDLQLQTEYAVEDADITWQLKVKFEKELISGNLTKLFEEVELPLVNVLASMEIEGINLNEDFLAILSKELALDTDRLESLFSSRQMKS